jgi:hypothetical protein
MVKRCIDAAEQQFVGLRHVASGNGCDPGPSMWKEDLTEATRRAQEETVKPYAPEGWQRGMTEQIPGRMHREEPEPERRDAIPPPAPVPSAEIAALRRTTEESIRELSETVRRLTEPRMWIPRRDEIVPYRSAEAGTWLRIKPAGWAVLARLTWAWICCAAGLGWRGVRRVFGSDHSQ